MLNLTSFKTITDIRQHTLAVMQQVQQTQQPVVVIQNSKPTGVVMSYERYQHLLEIAEDYYDLQKAQMANTEKKDNSIPLDEFWKANQLAK